MRVLLAVVLLVLSSSGLNACGVPGDERLPGNKLSLSRVGLTITGLNGALSVGSNFGNTTMFYTNGQGWMDGDVLSGNPWKLSLISSPNDQICQMTNISGVASTGDINVTQVACGPNAFPVSVNVDGLVAGCQVTLVEPNQSVAVGNGMRTLGPPRRVGTPLSISLSPPAGHTCTLSPVPGAITNSNVLLTVHCTPVASPVTFSATGLPSGGQVDIAYGAQAAAHLTALMPLSNANSASAVPYGAALHAVAMASPASVSCVFSSGASVYDGVMTPGPLVLPLTCSQAFAAQGTVTGLFAGSQLVLSGGGVSQTVSATAPSFSIPRALPAGQPVALAVTTQPKNQLCTVSGLPGGSASGDVSGVTVSCVPFLRLTSGQAAVLAVGQPDLVSSASGAAANQLALPWNNPAIDASGALYVTSATRNLAYKYSTLPTANNPSYDLTLSQALASGGSATTLQYPAGVATMANLLAVIDDHGVNFWTSLPTTNRAPDFALNASGCTPAGFGLVQDVTFFGSAVGVGDRPNRRLSIWRSMPASSGQAPDAIIGQVNATTCTSGAVDAVHTGSVEGVTSDASVTIVAATEANRLMVWNQPMSQLTTGQAADLVLGAPDAVTAGSGAATATTFQATKVLLHGPQMFVSDFNNNRILVWNQRPTSPNTPADVVLGQASMTVGQCNRGAANPSATSLCGPHGMTATQDALWVNDHTNNRILKFVGQ